MIDALSIMSSIEVPVKPLCRITESALIRTGSRLLLDPVVVVILAVLAVPGV